MSVTASEDKQPFLRAKKLRLPSPRRPALDRLQRLRTQTMDRAQGMDQASGMAQHSDLLAAVNNLTLQVQRLTTGNTLFHQSLAILQQDFLDPPWLAWRS